ncbi:MAG: hypothetical protein NTY61_02345 [Candidatus Parcubacteria bacterium]|nr:hypothetical protein [Candidatus Parcubacteria bacterium]
MKRVGKIWLAAIMTIGLFLVFSVVSAAGLGAKLSGRILLQTESHGEAWYVNPVNQERYYLGRASDAFDLMKQLGQ